ncbi:calponin homology domain-containing protein DDB_G0272472-like [Camellia sinensis]|uniref:calponin homology domain-containing protein DDB_G0272472-like n=1 Tax=Camellia sinensis TaxID=4442 RepID=UPI0010359465|nr:calponin homology domain-containing protein DDB_G0272472-like [Camellia sinensis]
MEAEIVAKPQAVNPCCVVLKEKYSKLEASRNALRQAYEEERVQADAERQEKANESAIRVSLENEISFLKFEILSLHQRGGSLAQDVDGEVILLRTRLSEMEMEIKRFEELVKKERMETDSERRKADVERKEANEAQKIMKAEKSRAAEERRLADTERKKVEENRIQLEKLNKV